MLSVFLETGKIERIAFLLFLLFFWGKLTIESAIIKRGLMSKICTESHLFMIHKVYLYFNVQITTSALEYLRIFM